MSRLPVSVIVTASGSPDDFRACLESLRPTLGVRDEVVCVFPIHRTDLRAALRGKTWLTVLDDDSGDQATRWSMGCDATRHPIVVLLDGDVVVSPHWLDPVVGALDDSEVVAAGPRCNRSIGPQSTDLPEEAMDAIPRFQQYARRWRQKHAGRFSDEERLGPVCVAIRREALARAGGPTINLPYDELRAQGRLVVAHGALVAHVSSEQCAQHLPPVSTEAPLVSASMIVKDEEDVLAECLTALRDFVDEIVVYDTGSTDRTRDIAREHGARVIEGYWNDHFSDARNRSLAHCTGQWVLILDADEVISGDPDAMRAQVSAATGTSFFVGVESLTGHGTTVWGRQLSPRLVRRNRLTFIRRLHEQMVDRVGGGALPGPDLQGITLTHSGYTLMRSVAKNKHERNLRLAHLAAGDQKDGIWAVVNLARSQMFAGRFEEAIETAQGALDEGMREQRAGFLKVMVEAYEGLGRYADAHATLDRLREVAQYSATADELEARVCNREGDFTRALAIVEAMPEDALDDSLIAIDESRSAPLRIESLFGLRRYREAAQALRDCVREGQLPHSVESIAEVLTAAGSSVAELAILHPRPALRGLLLAATEAPDALADDLFEALWQQHGAAMILASAARIGGRLPVMRAMEWAARLRQHGYSEQCTLLALAGNPVRTPRDRVLAAAIALELFSDERAMPLLEEALGAVPDDENDQVLQELRQLAPTVAAAVEPAGVA